MVGVGNQRLRVEHVATNKLARGHGQINQEANSCNPDAGVAFILREQVWVVMMVVMAVAMAGMAPGLGRHQRDGGLGRMGTMTIPGR